MNQQVVYQEISQIHPYENNPRNNEAAVGPVAQSIKEFGFRVPILIDGKARSLPDTPAMRPQNGWAWTKCPASGSMT